MELAKRGAEVIVNYNGSKEAAEAVVREITEAGGHAQSIQCDVSDYAACEQFIRDVVDRCKKIDILVNNAGINKDTLLMKMSEEEFDSVLSTNLKGTFHTMRFVSRQMLRQKSGKIVNIASVVGLAGNAGQANYAASKAGVIGLTKSAAKELAGRSITVNAVAPGFIETDMTQSLGEQVKEHALTQIPMGRFGSAQDVAQAVGFLVSEESAYITGQVICVDGGMLM